MTRRNPEPFLVVARVGHTERGPEVDQSAIRSSEHYRRNCHRQASANRLDDDRLRITDVELKRVAHHENDALPALLRSSPVVAQSGWGRCQSDVLSQVKSHSLLVGDIGLNQ
jgi:hypothetical protein